MPVLILAPLAVAAQTQREGKKFNVHVTVCREQKDVKPGVNPEPVTHTNESFPVSIWQKYASPVWMDINPSDTLQKESAREEKDERHICPLQLGVIRRAINLWTNPDDIVLTPFLGIGSEAYVALEYGRRAIGIELKPSYYEQAVKNCAGVVACEQISLL